jgi:pantothenate kinase type III
MVERIRAEWPTNGHPRSIATGGLARLVAPICTRIDAVDLELTLNGLRIAARHLGLAW